MQTDRHRGWSVSATGVGDRTSRATARPLRRPPGVNERARPHRRVGRLGLVLAASLLANLAIARTAPDPWVDGGLDPGGAIAAARTHKGESIYDPELVVSSRGLRLLAGQTEYSQYLRSIIVPSSGETSRVDIDCRSAAERGLNRAFRGRNDLNPAALKIPVAHDPRRSQFDAIDQTWGRSGCGFRWALRFDAPRSESLQP
jgi:hypothetical protein